MRIYIVKEGDTLSSIAEKYGLELDQLLAINPQITDPDKITPGMKVKIAAGPVSIAPGQPEIGHSITPVGQVETPFTQFPSQTVEAGGAGGTDMQTQGMQMQSMGGTQQTYSTGSNNLQGNNQYGDASDHVSGAYEMTGSGHTLTPMGSMTYGDVNVPHEYGPSNVSSGMSNVPLQTSPFAGMNQQHMSTIPQHFANHPMYSGVASFDDKKNDHLIPQSVIPSLPQTLQTPYQGNQPIGISNEPLGTGNIAPLSSNVPMGTGNVAPLSSNVPMGTDYVAPFSSNVPMGASNIAPFMGNVSPNTMMPYTQQSPNSFFASNTSPNLWSSGSIESYTWSTPFDYMKDKQTPHYQVQGMPQQMTYKKPCGCGGGKRVQVGHYSLQEKLIAEGAESQQADSETVQEVTSSVEERITALEQRIEDRKNDERGDSAAKVQSAEQAIPANKSVNRKKRKAAAKRTDIRKKRTPRAQVHSHEWLHEPEPSFQVFPWLNV